MLSDEITTGSIRTTDSDKKILASRSHAWNLTNQKFTTIFPEYSEYETKDLPNMGEKPRKKEEAHTEVTGNSAGDDQLATNSLSTSTLQPFTRIGNPTPKPHIPVVANNNPHPPHTSRSVIVMTVIVLVASLFFVRILQ
jgi:ubiquitin-conjugating enzyme E2 J2